jgi:hypothetical protein
MSSVQLYDVDAYGCFNMECITTNDINERPRIMSHVHSSCVLPGVISVIHESLTLNDSVQNQTRGYTGECGSETVKTKLE